MCLSLLNMKNHEIVCINTALPRFPFLATVNHTWQRKWQQERTASSQTCESERLIGEVQKKIGLFDVSVTLFYSYKKMKSADGKNPIDVISFSKSMTLYMFKGKKKSLYLKN